MTAGVTRKSLTYINDDCHFYPHQVEGVRHLARLTNWLLGDEPGLGKTLQALTVFAIDVERGIGKRMLVVCPATLKGNWKDEIKKHTSFSYEILQGTKDQREKIIQSFGAGSAQILIVNYEQVKGHLLDLNRLGFDLIVYDEAHAIKGYKSQRTKACHGLHGRRHGLLTGTPIMNNVGDLWSLLYRIAPHEFPNYWTFLLRYAVYGGFKNKQIIGVKNEKELKEKVNRYMLRRRKADVLDLPEKQIIPIKVDLSPLQRKVYKQVWEEEKLSIPLSSIPDEEIDNALVKFLRLKQVCGTTSTQLGYPDDSAKLDRVEELIEELASNGHHVVVFTQFLGVLDAMKHRLASLGAPTFVLSGAVPIPDRIPTVKRWSEHPRPAVMLAMLQVGGVGVTMTKARHMIFIDEDFTPAINEQAEDRVHRIGADLTQPVQIYKFLCRGTIETRVQQILRQKDRVIGSVVNDSDFKRKLIAAMATDEEDDE